jgi:hypothetical protein
MKDLKTTSAGVDLILSGVMWFLHLINPEVAGPDLGTRTRSARR